MQRYRTLVVDEIGMVATVTLNSLEGNGDVDMAMLDDLEKLVVYLEDNSECSLVIFRGARGIFCRGLNPSAFGFGSGADIHMHNRWEKWLIALERLPKLTLAVIDGLCVGAGVQLALACDHRIATTQAVMQLPEVKGGYLPGMALFRLAKYVGLGIAKRMVLTGMPWNSADAIAWGLVDWRCEPSAITAMIEYLVEQILPTDLEAVCLARRLLNESFAEPVEEVLGTLLAAQHRCISRPTASDMPMTS